MKLRYQIKVNGELFKVQVKDESELPWVDFDYLVVINPVTAKGEPVHSTVLRDQFWNRYLGLVRQQIIDGTTQSEE
jgi:hypothetical protein